PLVLACFPTRRSSDLQKGLRVLVLERGRMVRHVTGYTDEHTKPWNFRYGGKPDRALDESDYPIQSTTYNFDETTRQFFINDRLKDRKSTRLNSSHVKI